MKCHTEVLTWLYPGLFRAVVFIAEPQQPIDPAWSLGAFVPGSPEQVLLQRQPARGAGEAGSSAPGSLHLHHWGGSDGNGTCASVLAGGSRTAPGRRGDGPAQRSVSCWCPWEQTCSRWDVLHSLYKGDRVQCELGLGVPGPQVGANLRQFGQLRSLLRQRACSCCYLCSTVTQLGVTYPHRALGGVVCEVQCLHGQTPSTDVTVMPSKWDLP